MKVHVSSEAPLSHLGRLLSIFIIFTGRLQTSPLTQLHTFESSKKIIQIQEDALQFLQNKLCHFATKDRLMNSWDLDSPALRALAVSLVGLSWEVWTEKQWSPRFSNGFKGFVVKNVLGSF